MRFHRYGLLVFYDRSDTQMYIKKIIRKRIHEGKIQSVFLYYLKDKIKFKIKIATMYWVI